MLQEALTKLGCDVTPCGSRITCNPPPMDTDEDWLVILPETLTQLDALELIAAQGFNCESEQYGSNAFESWRNGNVNLIVTPNKIFGALHKRATRLCKELNLMVKADRIKVFQELLYGAET